RSSSIATSGDSSSDGSSRTLRTSRRPLMVTVTSPPPAVPSTVRAASSSCIPASRSCICWACRSRPGMSNGLATLTLSSRATLTHTPPLGAKDAGGRLHDGIRKGFLRAAARARERQLVCALGRNGPDLDAYRCTEGVARDPTQPLERLTAREVPPHGLVV